MIESTVLETTGTPVDNSVSVIGVSRGSSEGMHVMLFRSLSPKMITIVSNLSVILEN